jgi:hypothetical protein
MRKPLAIVVLAGCLALAACGDDDDDAETAATTTSQEEAPPSAEASEGEGDGGSDGPIERDQAPAPEQVVELVLTTTNPEDACVAPHVTESFVKSAYGSASGCAQALGEGGPISKSVTVEPVDDSGDEATTIAVASGGVYDGEEIEVRLVRDHDAWSVDAIRVDVPAGP